MAMKLDPEVKRMGKQSLGEPSPVRTSGFQAIHKNGYLWPPVADALDTFLRRSLNKADAYERVWRLIHLWEATGITLALAAISRMRQEADCIEAYRRQREFFHGKSWDPLTESFKTHPGAAHGSIDQWINILEEVAKAKSFQSRFLSALNELVTSRSIDISPLISAWAKTCDVPTEYELDQKVEVRRAMRFINSFRNRFAHVPFPHDPLEEVAKALQGVTLQLFEISPSPAAHEKDGKSSAQTGGLVTESGHLWGNQFEQRPQMEHLPAETSFVFQFHKKDNAEFWPTNGLVHVDAMMRPHILTRLRGGDQTEYTRFRAEANAVIIVAGVGNYSIPSPERADYPPSLQAQSEGEVVERQEFGKSEALEAIRNGDFDPGIEYFQEYVRNNQEYHVGWLRLGHARREKAVRLLANEPSAAKGLLEQALEDLERAAKHTQTSYRALAHYERSKTYYRLAQLGSEGSGKHEQAIQEAEKACKLSTEQKYQTWWEYLKTYSPQPMPGS